MLKPCHVYGESDTHGRSHGARCPLHAWLSLDALFANLSRGSGRPDVALGSYWTRHARVSTLAWLALG